MYCKSELLGPSRLAEEGPDGGAGAPPARHRVSEHCGSGLSVRQRQAVTLQREQGDGC